MARAPGWALEIAGTASLGKDRRRAALFGAHVIVASVQIFKGLMKASVWRGLPEGWSLTEQ